MASNKRFLGLAESIRKRDKQVFDTLMEFEKTKRIRTKTRMNFTIDKSVAERFKKFCRNNGYNMSAKIEQSIKDIIEKSK